MSLIHFEWIGHIDPSDPYEFRLPIEPKVWRPISRSVLERRIGDAPKPLQHMVHYSDEGLVKDTSGIELSPLPGFWFALQTEPSAVALSIYAVLPANPVHANVGYLYFD